MDADVNLLSRSLVGELAGSIGCRNSPLVQRIMWATFRPVTDRLARIGARFDQEITQVGFSAAMGNVLKDFIHQLTVRGRENIPSTGPLLVLSNHPGTYDSLIISSTLHRDDLGIISSDIPFLMRLPHAQKHFFFLTARDQNTKAVAARQAVRHLRECGAVLLYGFGHIDPDPAVYDDAPAAIEKWSPSIDLFLKLVPEVRVLITLTSHVVSPKWRHSLLYHLRRNPIDRRRIVEFGQVISQLLFPGAFHQSPYISFSPPVTPEILRNESPSRLLLPAVIARGKALLKEHIDWINSRMKF